MIRMHFNSQKGQNLCFGLMNNSSKAPSVKYERHQFFHPPWIYQRVFRNTTATWDKRGKYGWSGHFCKAKRVNIMYILIWGYIQSSNIILYGKRSVLIDVNRLRDTNFLRFETICKRNKKSMRRWRQRQPCTRSWRRRCRCAFGNSLSSP